MYLHDHKGRLSQALCDLLNIGRRYLLRLDPPTHLSFSRDLNAMNLVIRVTGKPNRVNEDVTLFLGSCGLGYGVLKLSHQGGFSKMVMTKSADQVQKSLEGQLGRHYLADDEIAYEVPGQAVELVLQLTEIGRDSAKSDEVRFADRTGKSAHKVCCRPQAA